MQLAFKCNAFAGRENALETASIAISNAGFKNIGLVFDRPYLWLEDLSPQKIWLWQKRLTKRHLSVASVSACTASGYTRDENDLTPPGQRFGPSFASKDRTERRLRIKHTKKVIDFAYELNCYLVDISTGYQPRGIDFARAWSFTKECLDQVCSYAAQKNVSINIEYEPGKFGPGGLFVGSASTALAMCKDVGLSNLGINLDLIHAAVCGEDIPATIRLLRNRLHIVEFDDMKSVRDKRGILRRKHEHLIPGDGELAAQYPAIFEALEEIGYNGPVIVELYNHFDKDPDEACKRSFEYLMTNFGKYFN